eukprot:gene14168-10120_t
MSTSGNVAKVMIDLFEEQATMLKDHADRLRKALSEEGNTDGVPAGSDGKKKGKRGKKDGKPVVKRALNGFQMFMKENLKAYRERHPELAPKEVLTIISQRWKNLADDKKSKYNNDAHMAKADEVPSSVPDVHVEAVVAPESAKKRKRSNSDPETPAPVNSQKDSGDEKKKKKHKKHKSKHDEDSS